MKIGFTVGCWRLLHHGHINHLKEARQQCDYLIVGIMNDYWINVQKGREYPIENIDVAINNLRKTGLCDKIIELDTLNMSPYLQIADVWFKGEDQKNMRPEKFDNIIIIPRTQGISTTQIIEEKINADKQADFREV